VQVPHISQIARWLAALSLLAGGIGQLSAQEKPKAVLEEPILDDAQRLPIDLPTALRLAQANAIDVAAAAERTRLAQAQLEKARVAWLPNIIWGFDYARHDGRLQDVVGNALTTDKSSIMLGWGPTAVVSTSDAFFAPLAARQVVRSRQAGERTAANDTTLAVAEAYFNVQQARGELVGAVETVRLAQDLVNRAEKLARGLAPPVEANRARAEFARRRQALELVQERWQTGSTELARLLRLDQTAVIEPIEPPQLRVDYVDASMTADSLIPIALTNRPELAAQQALVQATLARLRQERLRPLMPSVLLRGNATNPAGTFSGGSFAAGTNGNLSDYGGRYSFDLQLVWEFQNLGLGNRAATRERRSENELALLELFRVQDRVAADVAQAHAQARRSANRVRLAEDGLKDAQESVAKNLEGLSQTRRIGGELVLVFRPQEVVAAIQALDQAYRDYYGAVADSNRAQFRLCRALGCPAQMAAAGHPPVLPAAPAPK
jgi:outer membrane protein TolC